MDLCVGQASDLFCQPVSCFVVWSYKIVRSVTQQRDFPWVVFVPAGELEFVTQIV